MSEWLAQWWAGQSVDCGPANEPVFCVVSVPRTHSHRACIQYLLVCPASSQPPHLVPLPRLALPGSPTYACREKDASTTQAALGFKICGMQVYRHGAGGYWRASKRWCKTLPVELVDKALLSFAHNGACKRARARA